MSADPQSNAPDPRGAEGPASPVEPSQADMEAQSRARMILFIVTGILIVLPLVLFFIVALERR